ncbi:MAG: sigma 54-interacting transcriptional regulator [Gemmatimonadetes bacterium]|nr:sigma 54-interacting transcriptional regulator [Gemmatimonadota bacterium]
MQQPLGNLEVCLAQKANMEAIFHSVADGIITVDPELAVTNMNIAVQKMLRMNESEGIARPIGDVLAGRLWPVSDLLGGAIETGEPARDRENVVTDSEGNELRVLLSASHLLDRDDSPAGGVVIVRDITHVRELETRLEDRSSLHGMVGRAHAMQQIYELIDQVAPTDSTVLIQGESGTGKELVADAIHRSSRRQSGPFIKINCSALSESLLESELFGHVRGAFTGALHDKKGRFELASGGTIFLDEVGDLSERIQVKLLRVLQEREIERVGDARTIPIDVRILAATNRPLRGLVDDGAFREDLFFRLNVIPIELPPLRDRRADIPDLAALFLGTFAERMRKPVEAISPDAMRALMNHAWPGNVRELQNAIEHGAVKSMGKLLLLEDLPPEIVEASARVRALAVGAGRKSAGAAGATGGAGESVRDQTSGPASGRTEARRIQEALQSVGGNRSRAAALLGIDRSTLWRRMKKYGI